MTRDLDETDREILKRLQVDCSKTYSQIGQEIGVSRTTVKNRIAEMEQGGIIRGYHASVDYPKANGKIPFILNFDVRADCFEGAKNRLKRAPETKVLFQTVGHFHLVAICEVESMADMRNMVNSLFREVEGIGDNLTYFPIMDTVKGGFTD